MILTNVRAGLGTDRGQSGNGREDSLLLRALQTRYRSLKVHGPFDSAAMLYRSDQLRVSWHTGNNAVRPFQLSLRYE